MPGEVFEPCHRLGDLVGAGDSRLQALDEAAQGMSGDDDAPKVVLRDEAGEVGLGTGADRSRRHLADATKALFWAVILVGIARDEASEGLGPETFDVYLEPGWLTQDVTLRRCAD